MTLQHQKEWIKFFRDLKKAIGKNEVPNNMLKFGNYLIAHNNKDIYFVMVQSKSNPTLIVKDLCNCVDEETANHILEVFHGIFVKKLQGIQYLNKIDNILQILDNQKE